MKKLFFILVLCLVWGGSVFAENLFLKCEFKNSKWGTTFNYEFDLKNKKHITAIGNEIDMAYTEDEIIFQSYTIDKSSMFSFTVNRKTGQGFVQNFDYGPIIKDAEDGKLYIQMAHSHLRYPDLSDEDKALFSIRDYANKTFVPKSMSEMNCSKIEKSF